jgi:hypothetical protein
MAKVWTALYKGRQLCFKYIPLSDEFENSFNYNLREILIEHVGYMVLTAVVMKRSVFWDLTP